MFIWNGPCPAFGPLNHSNSPSLQQHTWHQLNHEKFVFACICDKRWCTGTISCQKRYQNCTALHFICINTTSAVQIHPLSTRCQVRATKLPRRGKGKTCRCAWQKWHCTCVCAVSACMKIELFILQPEEGFICSYISKYLLHSTVQFLPMGKLNM